jgi:3-hydroxyisobutyrate dehydrogenase-like beta-hydroxyacid dehydrogenase
VVDVNSVSPAAKQAAARAVEAAGGRYVEAAVMASVPPKGLRSPMLLGGPHAAAFLELMAPFGMGLKVYSEDIGKASSVKMCRSVMVKGLEALTTECMLAARHYGVEADVLRSLSDTLPHDDWRGLARYVISRALIHGKRRAEEMREVARTVEEAGIAPLASRAIAERQDWAAVQGRAMGPEALATTDLDTLLDALREAMREPA